MRRLWRHASASVLFLFLCTAAYTQTLTVKNYPVMGAKAFAEEGNFMGMRFDRADENR